jgi:hypothetical protein
MLSRTEPGVVVAINGDHLTILLPKNTKIKVKVKQTDLKLGSRCGVAFNLVTNKVSGLINQGDFTVDNSIPIPDIYTGITPEEISELENWERECSREQKFEGFELEDEDSELELWEIECSRQQSFEGFEGEEGTDVDAFSSNDY